MSGFALLAAKTSGWRNDKAINGLLSRVTHCADGWCARARNALARYTIDWTRLVRGQLPQVADGAERQRLSVGRQASSGRSASACSFAWVRQGLRRGVRLDG